MINGEAVQAGTLDGASKDEMFVHTIRALGILISGTGYEHAEKAELFNKLANNVISLTDNPTYYLGVFQEMVGQPKPMDSAHLN